MENRQKLLIASFLTLVAAGVGFATRGAAGPAWAEMGITQAAIWWHHGCRFCRIWSRHSSWRIYC